MRLKEKVVLITGATGEIGTAMTQRFLAEGASVCITGRSAEKLADINESLGAGAKLTTCLVDALDEAAVLSSVERCVAEFGGIDAIIANAGTEGKVQPLETYSVEEFNATLLVNVTGVWLYLKHGLPPMRARGGGSFVAISSGAGTVGFPGLCPYAASKHAVNGLVRTACLENASFGIRVNALAPGPTDTRMMESVGLQANSEDPAAFKNAVISTIPMQRYGKVDEIAKLAVFLASEDSSFCNGGVYMADGGFTAA